MFLLLTDYHSGKKTLVNFDSVRRVDVFQDAYTLITFNDPATPIPCKEPFVSICETILRSNSVPEYITGTEEYAPLISSKIPLEEIIIPEWQKHALDFWLPTSSHSEQYVDGYLKIKNDLTPDSDHEEFLNKFMALSKL